MQDPFRFHHTYLEQMYQDTDEEEEAEFIESALDNLSFTEDMQLFSLLDLEEDGEELQEGLEDEFDLDLFEEDEDEDLEDKDLYQDNAACAIPLYFPCKALFFPSFHRYQ